MRRPQSHVRVAREVAVNANRERDQADPEGSAIQGLGRGKRGITIDGQPIGDRQLLEQAKAEKLDPQARPEPAPCLGPRGLRQEVPRTHDGPGDQMREEEDEEHEVRQALLRLHPAPVNIDRVADRLERVERNPEGNDDLQGANRGAAATGNDGAPQGVEEEVDVLEVAEKPEIHAEAHQQERLAEPWPGRGVHGATQDVVHQRGGRDDKREFLAPGGIEVVARPEKPDYADLVPGHDPVDREDHRKEAQEGERVELHG